MFIKRIQSMIAQSPPVAQRVGSLTGLPARNSPRRDGEHFKATEESPASVGKKRF
jgi:hypothetical protein